ncbi:hypothetical protein BLNAU_18252 [Blattamonas nauphoetae]|uniref:Uncharacterized protein n=1 Tax=Blattamonas nauphoetae TaxID=2049346 RepID=A0ABQ9X643_9EUKA|nr:hypothetical protein BLNAU_18252 [Blattamonas nauphoetae]
MTPKPSRAFTRRSIPRKNPNIRLINPHVFDTYKACVGRLASKRESTMFSASCHTMQRSESNLPPRNISPYLRVSKMKKYSVYQQEATCQRFCTVEQFFWTMSLHSLLLPLSTKQWSNSPVFHNYLKQSQ